jgi:hypothetical protein
MLRKALRAAGIDRAVFFSLLNRGVMISAAVVTLVLVVVYFPPELQGYYYTFTSLLVLQTILDLGMGTVLVQFVSHEWSKLDFDARGNVCGDEVASRRVAGLLRVGLLWYAVAAVAFFGIVGAVGSLLLKRYGTSSSVLWPWWLLCGAVSVSIFQVPLRSVLEGSNQVARVQKAAAVISILAAAAGWIAIVSGWELYSLAMSVGVTALLAVTVYGTAARPFLRLLRDRGHREHFSWQREFWPQQWRIATSFMAGFCVFQSFVPILFYYQGPVVAGKMGASLQIYNAINSIGLSWANARGPYMGLLGARGEIGALKAMVRHTFARSRLAVLACAIAALVGLGGLHAFHYRADRFIGIVPLAVLLGTLVLLQKTAIETLAIRFQKIEPFVLNSIVSALLMVASNVLMSRFYGIAGVCLGFAVVMLGVTIPWTHRTYVAKMEKLAARATSGAQAATSSATDTDRCSRMGM